jgi:hypothetical protein
VSLHPKKICPKSCSCLTKNVTNPKTLPDPARSPVAPDPRDPYSPPPSLSQTPSQAATLRHSWSPNPRHHIDPQSLVRMERRRFSRIDLRWERKTTGFCDQDPVCLGSILGEEALIREHKWLLNNFCHPFVIEPKQVKNAKVLPFICYNKSFALAI